MTILCAFAKRERAQWHRDDTCKAYQPSWQDRQGHHAAVLLLQP